MKTGDLTNVHDDTRAASPTAYLSITRILGADPDGMAHDYLRWEPVMTGVGRTHGLLVHAAAKTAEGLLVVNLWPSQDGSVAAAADPRRLGVIAASGLRPEDFRREHHDVIGHVLFG